MDAAAAHQTKRAAAIEQILTWVGERDPFWTLPQVRANYRSGMERMSDEDLRSEYRRHRPRVCPAVRVVPQLP